MRIIENKIFVLPMCFNLTLKAQHLNILKIVKLFSWKSSQTKSSRRHYYEGWKL